VTENPLFRWASAELFCIEALPATAVVLQKSVSKLNLDRKGFHIVPAALSRQDGTAWFPKSSEGAGREDVGIDYCNSTNSSSTGLCQEIPVYSIDTFVNQKWDSKEIIHFLSIDVEGYDIDVLLGGVQVLKRVEYLEFEYHRIGSWVNYPLSAAIDPLDSIGFTCYWAGSGGRLWRITGCYRNVYNFHYWSNVACVNRALVPVLAQQMEERFLNQLNGTNK
jgi:FkbM family methyltransferase